jgi:superfamily II DNA or RNA helicase
MHPHADDYKMLVRPIERRKYESSINLYDYQEQSVRAALKTKNGLLVMPCGGGKGLPIDAKICTPTGWKRNGDLQIGDAVVGSDGKATRVTGIFDRGKVDAYKITFSDGVETVCDKDHLWTVQKQSQRAESGNWDVMNTQAIYEHYQNMKCRSQYLYIPIVKPVEFYGYEDYRNMNPWLLGFLLGDGCFQKSMITMSTGEDDILEKVVDIIGKEYVACEWITHIKNYDWRFCGGNTLHNIRSLGLGCKHSYEKFIPKEYLFAPVDVRLAVLQGLFDADGHINGIMYEYSTTSKQLADDVVFIVESLGGTAKVKEKIPTYTYNGEKRTGRKAYRIYFKLYNFKPFTSKKHSAKYRERTHYNKAYRIIKKIEPCDPITSRCITVDAKDQLYVTEHFVVTHNTQTGLEAIARIGGRALWLTHTQDLLNQSKERAKNTLNLCGGTYGTITAGKVNIGTHITFATVQTMAKLDLTQYKDMFDVVVVDECQRCAGSPTRVTQFYKVVSSLSARYKIGLTATPKRADGLEKSMFALLGGIIHEVPKEAVKATTCPIKVQQIETGYKPLMRNVLMGDGTIDYSKIVEDLIHSDDRYNIVFGEILSKCKGPTIILANRVEYLQRMCDDLTGCGKRAICLSTLGQSKKAKQMRKESMQKLNAGELNFVLATYALAKEGLDCPDLRYVVFATPEKDSTTVIQSAGRVGRKAPGKEYGTVIDFVDDFGMYRSWKKKRESVYKKIDAEIE